MGRPREHGDHIAAVLLDAAEDLAQHEGLEAVSVRRVASTARTTTRAVYSLFGSKDGLIVALGTRAFEILGTDIRAMPATEDPAHDLTEAGIVVFRRFALEHPGLFGIGVQHAEIAPKIARGFYETARHALAGLQEQVSRLSDTGGLGGRTIAEATIEFHALCEGLAALELRGMLPEGREERLWRSALTALVGGFANG